MIRDDRIKNKYVKISIGTASVVEKVRENRLSWFGYVMREDKLKATERLWKRTLKKERKKIEKRNLVGCNRK